MRALTIISALLILSASCEKVIDIRLNEADQQVIVEAFLTDSAKQAFVKLSKTGSVYLNGEFEKVSSAIVSVTDGTSTWTFVEDPGEPGTYLDSTFVAQANKTYNLTINNSGDIYTATSVTQSDVAFDSLDYILSVGGFGQQGSDTSFFVFYNMTDNVNEENFYRFVPYKNGEKSGNMYLTNDQLINGNSFSQPFFGDNFESGDTLDAYVLSLDNPNYTYFYSLESGQGSGPFSPTPANPVSNIEGNAIGYFGVYMTDHEQIIFP